MIPKYDALNWENPIEFSVMPPDSSSQTAGGGQRNLFNGFGFHEIHELFLGVDVQLGVDVAHVGAGGAFGDEQLLLDEGSVAPFR